MAAAVSHDVQKQKLPRQFEDVAITFSHHASPFRLCFTVDMATLQPTTKDSTILKKPIFTAAADYGGPS